jgi:4-amino-4-deoxychorismate lyase
MRWEPEGGFLRLDRHLARLSASASVLGLECDLAEIGALLDGVGGPDSLRVRLLVGPQGEPTLTTHAFVPVPAGTVWRVAVAQTRLSSEDELLRHKTTRRAVYEAARAEFGAAEADEVILLNERGEVCEGTITSVFVDRGDGGPLWTPPLECGLLAGVLRGELIATGEAREAVLTDGDLRGGRAIVVGNSLRGLIAAQLVPLSSVDVQRRN